MINQRSAVHALLSVFTISQTDMKLTMRKLQGLTSPESSQKAERFSTMNPKIDDQNHQILIRSTAKYVRSDLNLSTIFTKSASIPQRGDTVGHIGLIIPSQPSSCQHTGLTTPEINFFITTNSNLSTRYQCYSIFELPACSAAVASSAM